MEDLLKHAQELCDALSEDHTSMEATTGAPFQWRKGQLEACEAFFAAATGWSIGIKNKFLHAAPVMLHRRSMSAVF